MQKLFIISFVAIVLAILSFTHKKSQLKTAEKTAAYVYAVVRAKSKSWPDGKDEQVYSPVYKIMVDADDKISQSWKAGLKLESKLRQHVSGEMGRDVYSGFCNCPNIRYNRDEADEARSTDITKDRSKGYSISYPLSTFNFTWEKD